LGAGIFTFNPLPAIFLPVVINQSCFKCRQARPKRVAVKKILTQKPGIIALKECFERVPPSISFVGCRTLSFLAARTFFWTSSPTFAPSRFFK